MDYEQIKNCIDTNNYKNVNVLRSVNHKFDSYGGIKFTFSEEMNENDISLVFKELKSIINNENDLLFVIFHEHFFAYHTVIKNEIKNIT